MLANHTGVKPARLITIVYTPSVGPPSRLEHKAAPFSLAKLHTYCTQSLLVGLFDPRHRQVVEVDQTSYAGVSRSLGFNADANPLLRRGFMTDKPCES